MNLPDVNNPVKYPHRVTCHEAEKDYFCGFPNKNGS